MAKDDAERRRKREQSRAVYQQRCAERSGRVPYSPFKQLDLSEGFQSIRGPKLEAREHVEILHQQREFAAYANEGLYHPSEIVYNLHLRRPRTFWRGFTRDMEGFQDGWDKDTGRWRALAPADFAPQGLQRFYAEYSAQHPERQWAGPRQGAWGDGRPKSQLPSHKIDRGINRPVFGLQEVLHSPAHLGPFERWKPARITAHGIQAGRVLFATGMLARGRSQRMHVADRPMVDWHLHRNHGLDDDKRIRKARRDAVDSWDKWMDWDGLAATIAAQGKQFRRAYQSVKSVQPDKVATGFSFTRKQMDRCYPYFVPTPHGSEMLLYTRPPAYSGWNRAQRETFDFALSRLAQTQMAEMTKPGSTLDPEVQNGIKARAITQARILATAADGGAVPLGEIPIVGPFGHRTGYLTDDGARARVVLIGGSGEAKTDMAKAMIQGTDAPLSVMIDVKRSEVEQVAREFKDMGLRAYMLDLTPKGPRNHELSRVSPAQSIHDYLPKPGDAEKVGFDVIGNAGRLVGPRGFDFGEELGELHFNAAKKKAEMAKERSDTNLDFYRKSFAGAVAAAHVAATLDKIGDIRAGRPDRPFYERLHDYESVMAGFEPGPEMRERIATLEVTEGSGMPQRGTLPMRAGEYRGPCFEALVRDAIERNRDVLGGQATEIALAAENFRSVISDTEPKGGRRSGGESIMQYLAREIRDETRSASERWLSDPGGFVEAATRAELAALGPGDELDVSRYPAAIRDCLERGPQAYRYDPRLEPGDAPTVRKLRDGNAVLSVAAEGQNEAVVNYSEQLFTGAVRRQYTELMDDELDCAKQLSDERFTLPAVLEAYRPTGGLPTKASQKYFKGADLWEARMAGVRLFQPPLQIVSDNEAGTRYWKEDPRVLATGYGIRQKGQLEIDSIPTAATMDKMGIGQDLLPQQIVISAGNFPRDDNQVRLAHQATQPKLEDKQGRTVRRPALAQPSLNHIRDGFVLGGTVGNGDQIRDARWLPVEDDHPGKLRPVEYTTAIKVDKKSGRHTDFRLQSHPTSQDSVYQIRAITPARTHPHTNWMPRYTADRALAGAKIRPEDGSIVWPEPEAQLSKIDTFRLRGARKAVSRSARKVAEAPTQLVEKNRHVDRVQQAVDRERRVDLSAINPPREVSSPAAVGQASGAMERPGWSGEPAARPWGTIRDRRSQSYLEGRRGRSNVERDQDVGDVGNAQEDPGLGIDDI